MKHLHRTALFLLTVFLIAITSCGSNTPSSPAKVSEVRLVGTIGPLSVPLAYMVENKSLASVADKTSLTIWANPTQLQAIVSGNQGDIVSLPTNSAALFYNRGIPLQLLDVSIWNILYIVTTDTGIKTAADLKGKRVVVPYQGAAPDAVFQVVLRAQGIMPGKDVEIFYTPDPIQATQLLLSGQENYALLSEPSATSAILKGQSSGKAFVRALNMQTEWRRGIGEGSTTPIAGTVVLGNLRGRPDVLKVFMNEYRKAVQWVVDNPDKAAQLGAKVLAEQGFSTEILAQSTRYVDWRFVSASDAQPDIEGFFTELEGVSTDFIGGHLPDAAFYYAK